jgi:dihydropteroate synthase
MKVVAADLERAIVLCRRSGVEGDKIIIDPGIGFGKTLAQNLEIIGRLAELKALARPLLLGVSRKSVIGLVLELPVEERLEGTAAASALGIAGGADIIRVHDVLQMRRVAGMSDAIVRRAHER